MLVIVGRLISRSSARSLQQGIRLGRLMLHVIFFLLFLIEHDGHDQQRSLQNTSNTVHEPSTPSLPADPQPQTESKNEGSRHLNEHACDTQGQDLLGFPSGVKLRNVLNGRENCGEDAEEVCPAEKVRRQAIEEEC